MKNFAHKNCLNSDDKKHLLVYTAWIIKCHRFNSTAVDNLASGTAKHQENVCNRPRNRLSK
jgi:hypothetical protein